MYHFSPISALKNLSPESGVRPISAADGTEARDSRGGFRGVHFFRCPVLNGYRTEKPRFVQLGPFLVGARNARPRRTIFKAIVTDKSIHPEVADFYLELVLARFHERRDVEPVRRKAHASGILAVHLHLGRHRHFSKDRRRSKDL